MNEAKNAADLVSETETKGVAETIRIKLELVRAAEDCETRIPSQRCGLYESLLRQIGTQISMLETMQSACEHYPTVRRELAQWEVVHRRMRAHGESREMAMLVLGHIADMNRTAMRTLLDACTTEQRSELARQAARRQVELENQSRYVRVKRGAERIADHLVELRQLRSFLCALLGKGKIAVY